MDLNHLETFLAVYEHRNLTRASEHLHLSQPAVSNHLRALEARLGRPLFVRQPRGVLPTALADSLARDITGPLDAIQATAAAYSAGAQRLDVTVYLGGPADALSVKVVPALVPLTTQGLVLRAVTGETRPLVDQLANGTLDIVVATTPTRRRGVRLDRLFDETLALVAAPSWAARLDEPDEEALLAAPAVAYAEDLQLIRRYWRETFGHSPDLRPRIVLDDLRGVLRTVRDGGGWTVLPTYLANDELQRGALQLLHRPADPPTNTLYLARRAGDAHRPELRAVASTLLSAAATW